MPKYISGRVKRTPQNRLTDDRYQYLGLDQAEPNIGDPPTASGTPGIPAGQQYQMVSVLSNPGERYWVPIGGGLIPGSVSVFEEGTLVGSLSSITQFNFVGIGITVDAVSLGIAATVTVVPPGDNGSVLFKDVIFDPNANAGVGTFRGDFSTSSDLIFNGTVGILTVGKGLEVGNTGLKVGTGGTFMSVASTTGLVGIATTNPTRELDVNGNIRLRKTIYDFNNTPGNQGNLLVKGTEGVVWIDVDSVQTGAGGTVYDVQYHNSAGLVDGAPNFVYRSDTSRVGIGSTQPEKLLDVVGSARFSQLEVSPGVSTFTGEVDANGGIVANSIRVEDLTQSRVVFIGVNGELVDDADFTYASATDTLSLTNLTSSAQSSLNHLRTTGISTLGNIKVDTNTITTNAGALLLNASSSIVQSDASVYISATPQSTSKDTGALAVDGGVGIEKNLNVGGKLSVAGVTTLASSGGITTTGGDLYVGRDLYVKRNFTQGQGTFQNLLVTGVSTFKGDTNHETTLIGNRLTLSGVSTFSNTVNIDDNKRINLGIGKSIFSDGSNLNIHVADTKNFEIKANVDGGTSGKINLINVGSGVTINGQGTVDVYHNNSRKLQVLSTGIDVAGQTKTFTLEVTTLADLKGSINLGSSVADDVIFHAKVNSNILPNTSGSSNLGSDSLRWDKIYANEYYGTFKGDIDPSVAISTTRIQQDNTFAEVVDAGSDGFFRVVTEDVERLIISAGIVTVSSQLWVGSDPITNSKPVLRWRDGDTEYATARIFGDDLAFETRDGGIDYERLRITKGGDVGIGTTNPIASNIEASLNSNTKVLAVGIVTANEYYGEFKGNINPGVPITNALNVNITDDTTRSGTHYIHFGSETSGFDDVEVDSSGLVYVNGKVGIGTTQPDHELQIFADEPNIRLTHTGSSSYLNSFYIKSLQSGAEFNSYQEITGTRKPFIFKQNSTEVFRIGPSGQFGLSGANYGTAGQVLSSAGPSSPPTWEDAGSGSLTDILVDYTGRSTPCAIPITVSTPSAGTRQINIPQSSNAFGAKYVQTTEPTGSSVCDGDIWYDTDGETTASAFVPSGSIIMYNGDVAPSGWVICDNSAAAVAAGAPDLRDKFIVGTGNLYNRGNQGGSADAVVVSHKHTTENYVGRPNYAEPRNYGVGTDGNLNSTGDTTTVGEDGTNKNLPPYYAITFIMKI